jgi:hypothetical protein
MRMNQPMKTSQIPPMMAPGTVKIWSSPNPMSRYPSTLPPLLAQRVALRMSPVKRQAAARKRRPPSSGKPGSRLKTASRTLMNPRYCMTATNGTPIPAAEPANAAA